MQRFAVLLLGCSLLLSTTTASAIDREDFHFRAGVMLGFRLFDSHQDLYGGSRSQLRDYSDTPEHAFMGGLFLSVDFRMLTVEGMFEYIPTSLDESGDSATGLSWTIGVLYRIPYKVWKFTPYFKLEAGTMTLMADAGWTDHDRQGGLGGGVFFPIAKNFFGRVELMGQITDGYEDTFATNLTFRAGIGYRWGFSDDRDGDGIVNRKDKCPDDPEDKDGFEDEDGCPDPDNDGDGIPDAKDKCPGTDADAPDFAKTREDKDGYKDDDGCPDPDNDGDGIPDSKDKCPGTDADAPDFTKTKETMNGYQDDDGCPDTKPVVVPVTPVKPPKKFVILERAFFPFNIARLRQEDRVALNRIARVLLKNKKILKVEIHGHAGAVGADAKNTSLSRERAQLVRRYLIGRGIAPSRLVAKWHGTAEPVKDCSGIENRPQRIRCEAPNRRVEFKIVEMK